MAYSQNGAAFYYAAILRKTKADKARAASGKGSAFGDGLTVFLLACAVALIGAAIQFFSYLLFQVSAFLDALLAYIPFM